MADKIKHLVSKKKRRFMEDGFDLDLAYIKPNIIAMGFPSENLEGVYRNHLDDVHRFLDIKHKDRYKVYNLCSEKNYDPAKFGNRVSQYGFDDHNAPPFELIKPCCVDMSKWLDSNQENVAIVHCKAGKGRTGVMICAYLLYKKYFTEANEAMNYYADTRTYNSKGVTIPSQRRYITYFGYSAKNDYAYIPRTILLNSITFMGVPTMNNGTCIPSVIICQTKVILHKSKPVEVRKSQSDIDMDIGGNPVPICGDIKIDAFHKDLLFKKDRMFVFWFNTYFLERGVTLNSPNGGGVMDIGKDENGDRVIAYTIPKCYLDKANKDKRHRLFPESFAVRLNITIPKSCEVDGNVDQRVCEPASVPNDQRHYSERTSLFDRLRRSPPEVKVNCDEIKTQSASNSPKKSPKNRYSIIGNSSDSKSNNRIENLGMYQRDRPKSVHGNDTRYKDGVPSPSEPSKIIPNGADADPFGPCTSQT